MLGWKRSLLASALVVVAVGTMAVSGESAEAAKGGRGGSTSTSGSIRLVQSDPHLGGSVTFETSGGSRIYVTCYQGGLGDLVYYADQAVGTTFVLGVGAGSTWTAGEAFCNARLYGGKNVTVALTSFTASGG